MKLPYEPQHLRTTTGDRIAVIRACTHLVFKPLHGVSQDQPLYLADIDTPAGRITRHIHPHELRPDGREGGDEMIALATVMKDYLEQHGDWRAWGPCGWTARRREGIQQD